MVVDKDERYAQVVLVDSAEQEQEPCDMRAQSAFLACWAAHMTSSSAGLR